MNNKIKLLGIALLSASFSLTSCSDYLDVQLEDQLTIEKVFEKRATTLNYLAHVYSYLPYEAEYQGTNSTAEVYPGGDGAVVPMSDEAMFSTYQWSTYLNFRTGDWGPTTPYFNIWKYQYTGIEQAGIFMENVDRCPDLSTEEKRQMKAEARMVRAYSYFQLLRRYGPVYVWGDQRSNPTIKPDEIDRHTVDENVNFIVSEIDKAIEDLPLTLADTKTFAGRITKGAAMAAKSRILLYAASPLFNGCDLYKGKLINRWGDYLFPQAPDPQKWDKAAKAAKAVIDLGLYSLKTNDTESDPMVRAIKAYQNVQFEAWNEEIIWGYWPRYQERYYNIACFNRHFAMPPLITKMGCGQYCPSLKLVDSYPMAATGRYPIDPVKEQAYDSNGMPIVDPLSGYEDDGFVSGWEHPIEGPRFGAIKAHKSCVGRDARFYASVFANGFKFINDFIAGGNTEVYFQTGGNSPLRAADCVKVGYFWRRFIPTDIDYENGNWGTYFWFYYRLAEIYLNYAEACNEKPNREPAEALKYVNMIRNRAGLNNLEDAYPEYNFMTDQNALRQMIRKERMVELAFEGHRYYDARRWMIAEKEFTGPNWTLNLLATNYESSYGRTTKVWAGSDNLFEAKHYFFPINQIQLSEMKNITQNYGW